MAGAQIQIFVAEDAVLGKVITLLDAIETTYNRIYLILEKQHSSLSELRQKLSNPEQFIDSERRLRIDHIRTVSSYEIFLSGLFDILKVVAAIFAVLKIYATFRKTMKEGDKLAIETDILKLDKEVRERMHKGPVRIGIRQLLEACAMLRKRGFDIPTAQGEQFLTQEALLKNTLRQTSGTDEEIEVVIELILDPLKSVIDMQIVEIRIQ
jgi:hypothetical protein